jgi:erythromycin esterase-like protein
VRHLILSIYLSIVSMSAFSQKSDSPRVFSLQSFCLDSNTNWLGKIFDDKIKDDIQFVGLGEFTHGGEETILFKSKMIQYLIIQKGYRRLLLEYPDMMLSQLNNYLLHSSSISLDSVKIITKKAVGTTVLANTSFYDLMVWVKKYNLKQPNDMISLHGFDIVGASDAFADHFLYNYLLPTDHSYALDMLSRLRGGTKDSITVAELQWYYKHQESLKRHISNKSYNILTDDVQDAEYSLRYKLLQRSNIGKAYEFRDSIMANNVIASSNNSKAIIWAHNLHINTATDYAMSTGNHLEKAVGKKYFSILTDFSTEATVWLISNEHHILSKKTFTPDKKTAAYILRKKFKVDEGILFFTDLKPDQTLFNIIDFSGYQAVYGKGHPFDALVIFKNVSPFIFN